MRLLPLVTAAVLVGSATTEAAVLCAKPRGDGTYSTTVKIREQCRPAETQLDPVALGLQGPAGPQGGPGPTGAPGPGLVLREANGVLVGLVSDSPINENEIGASLEQLTIVRQDGPRFFAFEAGSDGVRVTNSDVQLSYAAAGCSGQAFLDPGTTVVPLIPRATVLASARAFYGAGARAFNTVLSLKEIGPSYTESMCTSAGGVFTPPETCCRPANCGPSPCTMSGAPAFEVDLSSLVAPFQVETQ